MLDARQLPFILKLLDDDSEEVQRAIAAALASFGPSLPSALSELRQPPEDWQVRRIRELLEHHRGWAGAGARRHTPTRPGRPGAA